MHLLLVPEFDWIDDEPVAGLTNGLAQILPQRKIKGGIRRRHDVIRGDRMVENKATIK
ncbi:MAG: hypothetical protein AAFP03_07620 [Cyanobacteria bacterium J06598_3]